MEIGDFRANRGRQGETLYFVPSQPGGGRRLTFEFLIVPDSLEPSDEAFGGYIAEIPTNPPLIIRFVFNEGADSYLVIRIEDPEEDITYQTTMVSISPRARRQFEEYARRGEPVPPLDIAALPRIKIPKGTKDFIMWTEIPDGAVMADFKEERSRHRYYTKETMDGMDPLINPGTNLPLQPNEITYYVAELDESLPYHEVHGARRKTRRRKHRKTRKSRRPS